MNIEDIRKTLSAMSDEELAEIIRGQRTLRSTPPKRKRAASKKAPKKKLTKAEKMKALKEKMKGMPPEMVQDLINQLG